MQMRDDVPKECCGRSELTARIKTEA